MVRDGEMNHTAKAIEMNRRCKSGNGSVAIFANDKLTCKCL